MGSGWVCTEAILPLGPGPTSNNLNIFHKIVLLVLSDTSTVLSFIHGKLAIQIQCVDILCKPLMF